MAQCKRCENQAVLGSGYCKECRKKVGILDREFSGHPAWMLISLLFCTLPTLLFSLCGAVWCKDPDARKNARIVFVVGLVFVSFAILIRASQ